MGENSQNEDPIKKEGTEIFAKENKIVDNIKLRAKKLTYKSFSAHTSKREKMHNDHCFRMDVVYKTVLRDMKRYYTDDFNAKTGFINCKRTSKSAFYAGCVVNYIYL